MAAEKASERVLRIGVIRGGKIVDDRYFRKNEPIQIGEGPKNTFIVPGVKKSHLLFEAQKGQGYTLAFTDKMQGQVAVDGKAVEFELLKTQGLVKKRGADYALPLNEQSKGRVVVGEITLLFQFVPLPPPPPKMELPPELRGNFWNSVDHTFSGILAAMLLVNSGVVGAVMAREVPVEEELSIEDIPDRYAKIIVPEKPPEKTPEELAAEKAAEDAAKKRAEEEAKKRAEEDKKKKVAAAEEEAKKPPKSAAEKEVERRKTVQSKGLLKILGASGPGASSALANVFAAGSAIGDIGEAFAGAGGVAFANEGNIGQRRGAAGGEAAGIGDLATKGGGNVRIAAKQDVAVSGSVSFGDGPEVESSTIDKGAVGNYVKGRVKSLQGCYERELKLNPSLKGKVIVRITIGTNGRVTECSEEQNTMATDAVSKCLCNYIRSWAFPFKPEEETAVTFPFVFSPAS